MDIQRPSNARAKKIRRVVIATVAVLLIAGYYLLLIFGSGLAREGTVPPSIGLWMGNIALFACGLYLLPRMEQFRGEITGFESYNRLRLWLRPRHGNTRFCDARAHQLDGLNGNPAGGPG